MDVSYLEDLDKLDKTIKDSEIRFRQAKASLDAMEKEIDRLAGLEIELERNLVFLKKKHIIALAVEFRRAKIALTNTKNRLAFLRIDRENVRRAYNEIEAFMKKCRELYIKTMTNSGNNVIHIDFRRKDG